MVMLSSEVERKEKNKNVYSVLLALALSIHNKQQGVLAPSRPRPTPPLSRMYTGASVITTQT
jgi:hypothetical protein